MKASDRRLSPPEWLEAERAFAGGPVAFDPCTEADNPAGALAYCTLQRNGLDANWRAVAREAAAESSATRAVTRLNPPWSSRFVWDFAAFSYAAEDHCIVIWSAVDFTAAWWRNLCRFSVLRCDLNDRPRCLDPKTGKRMEVGRSAACWLVGGDSVDAGAFAKAFAPLGAISRVGSPDWDPMTRAFVQEQETEGDRAAAE